MGLTVNEYSAAWHHDDDKSVVGQSLIQLIRMELDHHSVATHQLQERSNKNAYSLFIIYSLRSVGILRIPTAGIRR